MKFRNFIYSKSIEDEKITNIVFFDEIRTRLSSRISYQVFRSNEEDGTEDVRESYCTFGAANITLEEVEGQMVEQNTDYYEAITRLDLQFIAPNCTFRIPKVQRNHRRRCLFLLLVFKG